LRHFGVNLRNARSRLDFFPLRRVQMKSILDHVDMGRKEGASLVTGVGSIISPAVFADVKHESRGSQEARRFMPAGLCLLPGPFAGGGRSFRNFDLSLP
jgi:hypothetical protein